jgi:hypothetical protein
MSGEAERNYYKKQADSVKRSGERARSGEQPRAPGDRLRKTEATDAVAKKLKGASPSEKEAFYKKQKDSIEKSKALFATRTEKEAYNADQRKRLEASKKDLNDFRKEHKLGEYAEKKQFRVPDPSWFEDK